MTTQEVTKTFSSAVTEPSETSSVPPWCAHGMEAGILAALAAATFQSFFSEITIFLGAALTTAAAVLWFLHAAYLGRLPLLPGRALWLLVVLLGAGAVLSAARMNADATHPLLLIAMCILTFLVISGGFTEHQVTRYLGFLGLLGITHVVSALLKTRMETNGGADWTIRVLFESHWSLTAFLALSLLGIGTVATHAATENALDRDPRSMHSRVAWFSSPGVQMAVLGGATMSVVLLFLYLLPSLWALPLCSLLVTGWAVTLVARGKMPLYVAAIGILLVLALNTLSMGRPSGERLLFTTEVFNSNVTRLRQASAARATEGTGTAPAPKNVFPDWSGDNFELKGLMRNRVGRITAIFLGLFCLLALGLAARGMIRFEGPESILATGAFFGLVGLVVFSALGPCLRHPAVGLAGAGLLAIAAAEGSFDREVEI